MKSDRSNLLQTSVVFAVEICRYKGGLVAVKHLTPTANPESQEQLESFAKEANLLHVLQHRYEASHLFALTGTSQHLMSLSALHIVNFTCSLYAAGLL